MTQVLFLYTVLAAAVYRYNRPIPYPPREPQGPVKLRQWRRRPEAFHKQLGMSVETFNELVNFCVKHGLQRTRYMAVDEKLAIFIYICRFGISQWVAAEIFGRSPDTISRTFHSVLNALQPIHSQEVKQPSAFDEPAKVLHEEKNQRFIDCCGAIDGTHILIWVPYQQQIPWRNRKGWLSQNVFAACSLDGLFCFIHAGWEGSAHDVAVMKDAIRKGRFKPPVGKYYLADAGFYNCDFMLVPYSKTRYHLREWADAENKP